MRHQLQRCGRREGDGERHCEGARRGSWTSLCPQGVCRCGDGERGAHQGDAGQPGRGHVGPPAVLHPQDDPGEHERPAGHQQRRLPELLRREAVRIADLRPGGSRYPRRRELRRVLLRVPEGLLGALSRFGAVGECLACAVLGRFEIHSAVGELEGEHVAPDGVVR
ncbi:hypothetical protein DB35_03935 [Streptomyces abyssalis]|uniref:Uncharacterized protein n=1 Tax=Streptomyces abyssalis TaxID=933944 RepID=A0A1E7JQ31_9ACTN|nr:hypothetical protein AN215_13050 [Streptomyces abyssalis]OEU95134.1 hypothetical protein DB35_03935 [Streptomyces abyssalis]